jgi:hypothetical protein
MLVYKLRLGLGLLFLVLSGVIFARSWIAPRLDQQFDPLRLNLGGVMALVFGGLNIARWYAMRAARRARATPVRSPLQPDPSLVRPEIPNPELDFTRQTTPDTTDRGD